MSQLDSTFSDNIVLDVTGLLSNPIDHEKLKKEISQAEKVYSFSRRTPNWLGIPLRSANGETGENGLKSTGVYNSPDERIFKDTAAMQPYIRKIIDDIGAPTFKVRILKLKKGKIIGEHADNFQSPDIIRLHIPIVTHPLVEFWLDGDKYFIPPRRLSYLNVRKRHKVINNGPIDRLHLVIDVRQTPELIERVKKCAKKHSPL
jgi:hypothetical protein